MNQRYTIVGVVIVVASVAAFFTLRQSSISYTSIKPARESGSRVQIAGQWVKDDKFGYNASSNLFSFTMKDDAGEIIPVEYRGAKPNNFELAEKVVVTGRIEGEVFLASNILTKCPSKYEGSGADLKKM